MPKNKKSKKNLKKNIRVKRINIPKSKLDDKLKSIINIKIDNSRKTNPRTTQSKTAQPQQQQARQIPTDQILQARFTPLPPVYQQPPTPPQVSTPQPQPITPESKQDLKEIKQGLLMLENKQPDLTDIRQGLLRLENKTNLYNENFNKFVNNYPSLENKDVWQDVPDLQEETNIKRTEQKMPNIEPQAKNNLSNTNSIYEEEELENPPAEDTTKQTFKIEDFFDKVNGVWVFNKEKTVEKLSTKNIKEILKYSENKDVKTNYETVLLPLHKELLDKTGVDYAKPTEMTAGKVNDKIKYYLNQLEKFKSGKLNPEVSKAKQKASQVKRTKKKTEEEELEDLERELTASINKK